MSNFGFIIRESHKYLTKVLSKEQLGQLWINIIEYIETGSDACLVFDDQVELLAFESVREQIDKDKLTYESKCAKNRANASGRGK